MDLQLTLLAVRIGGFHEANPIARQVIHDPASLVLFKVVLVALSTTLLYLCRGFRVAEIACIILSGIYVVLMVLWGFYYYFLLYSPGLDPIVYTNGYG
jgi:hypothetical protein